MKFNKKKKKYTMEWPFNLMYLFFIIEIIFVLLIFTFMGGSTFFQATNLSFILIISLGLLTFVSIFFSFVSKEEKFERAFREIIDQHEDNFQKELEKNSKEKVNLKFLKDFQERYNAFKTYKFLVNPVLWLYTSIFLGLITILFSFAKFKFKFIFLSVMIHLQILSALFLITSIISVYIAYIAFKKLNKTAFVEYKIASVLPGTAQFNLLKDKKVWFWIANLKGQKYKVYINLELILDSYSEKLRSGYYGGGKPWNLNAFSGIHAPGIPISKKIINLVKKGEKLDIKINCEIKDEKDNFIENKLPVTYRYHPPSNSWYLEP